MIYLARVKETKEFVGVFSARTIEHLFWLVDECTDPFACEVLPMKPHGGIYAAGPAGTICPDNEDRVDATGISFAGEWDELPDDKAWKRFATHSRFERA